jgi:hypothetical protein
VAVLVVVGGGIVVPVERSHTLVIVEWVLEDYHPNPNHFENQMPLKADCVFEE